MALHAQARWVNRSNEMLFLRSTSSSIAPGIFAVDVAAKPPGKTFGIYIAVDADYPPQDLLGAIEGLGFKKTVVSPYIHNDGRKVIDFHFQKAGTDIFQGWKESEREENLRALQTLFTPLKIELKPRVMTTTEAFS
jgi:hypothetical protein